MLYFMGSTPDNYHSYNCSNCFDVFSIRKDGDEEGVPDDYQPMPLACPYCGEK